MKDLVKYRKFPEGSIIALFPDMSEGRNMGMQMINSYQHVGQHGAASLTLLTELEEATPEEYGNLEAELRQIGYDV